MGFNVNLKIEFSVPKLLFQNNIDELEDNDFNKVIDILQNKLESMGVLVDKKTLEEAEVSIVHFSKNIPICNFYTATGAIKEIRKLDVRKQLDINEKFFQNVGHALYFDCSSYTIVFYDKLQDINQSKRHSVNKEKIDFQLNLYYY